MKTGFDYEIGERVRIVGYAQNLNGTEGVVERTAANTVAIRADDGSLWPLRPQYVEVAG